LDVRDVVLGDTGRSGLGHRGSFGHPVAASEEKPPEMRKGCLVAVSGQDRDGGAVSRNLSGEGDLARCRSAYRVAGDECDVDSSMLASGVRVVA